MCIIILYISAGCFSAKFFYGGDTVRCNKNRCENDNCGLTANYDNVERYSNCYGASCHGTKRNLEPVLVAKVYNQTIVEEIPHYAMSMTLDNMSTITNVYSDGCSDGCFNNDVCNDGCEY